MRSLLSLIFFVLCCMKSIAQTYIEPVFDRTDAPSLHINKIEVTKDTTFVHCTYTAEAGSWAMISKDTYLYDHDKQKKYQIIRCLGLPFSPQKRDFRFGGLVQIVFCFPSVGSATKLDFIEAPDEEAFNIYGINMKEHYEDVYKKDELEHFSRMSSMFDNSGNASLSIQYKKKEIEAAKSIDGIKSDRYLALLVEMSSLFEKYGYYKEIIDELTIELTSIQDDSSKKTFAAMFKCWIGIANLYLKKEKESLYWFRESYSDFQYDQYRDQYNIYGILLINMSRILYSVGNYKYSYKIAEEACRVNKTLFGVKSEQYVSSLNILSDTELEINKKENALAHTEEAVILIDSVPNMEMKIQKNLREKLRAIHLKVEGRRQSRIRNFNEKSILLIAKNDHILGYFQDAIVGYKSLISYYESNIQSSCIENYISSVSFLVTALIKIGDYTESDKVLRNAFNLFQRQNVPSEMLTDLYERYGDLYYNIGDASSALYWLNLSAEYYEKSNNDMNLKIALLMSKISNCEVKLGNLSLAKQMLDKAYSICVNLYVNKGCNSQDRLLLLNNIASAYTSMDDYVLGKEIYEMIIADDESKYHGEIRALALLNLAEMEMFFLTGDLADTEKKLLEALEWDSSLKQMVENDLNIIHCVTKDEKALLDIISSNEAIKDDTSNFFTHFSEREREGYWSAKSQELAFISNLAAISFNHPQVWLMAYDNTLYTKSLLLNSERLLGSMVKECDSKVQDIYTLMQSLKEALVDKRTPNDAISNYYERINQYEKQIIAAIPNFSGRLKSQFRSTDDVKKMLSDNDVAIEFALFPKIKMPMNESILLLGALVLTSYSDAPALVLLCSEGELESLFDSNGLSNCEFVDSLYGIHDKRLYQMIWKQIEPYIKEGSSVYYSPTGYIHKINLSAISDGTRRLSDKYDLYEVSTTAMIESIKQAKNDTHSAVIFGDINYYEDSDTMEVNSKKYSSYSSGDLLVTRSTDRGTWDLLPATKDEVNSVESLMKKGRFQVQTFCGNEASEESFKALSTNAPDIIHVATHGFYFPSEEDISSSFFQGLNNYTEKDNSMLYSGLLFAGANNTWTGKMLADGVEDGILTADEISRLDMSGNKLTVLSACETGLGDINNIDGVFGLQRGFKKAGVGTILMSLWKVPDKETQQLMSIFYAHYLSGESANQALKIAQQQLQEQGKSPYYWAGFVLLD